MLSCEPLMAYCYMCQKKSEQHLTAHGPYICHFTYSCGCTSMHVLKCNTEEVTWKNKEGEELKQVINRSWSQGF